MTDRQSSDELFTRCDFNKCCLVPSTGSICCFSL